MTPKPQNDDDSRVVSEARVYGPASPNSYFQDVMAFANGSRDHGVSVRLQRHLQEVVHEVDHGTVEGRIYERQLRDQTRTSDPTTHENAYRRLLDGLRHESRSITTGALSDGVFVTPAFIVREWTPFRGSNRTFVDQTEILPIPEFGMSVHVPHFSSAASAGVQPSGENTAVTTLDPVSVDLTDNVTTFAGQIVLSQQLADRAYFGGGTYDTVMGQQLNEQLDEAIDRYVLQEALQAGASVGGSAAVFSVGNFYGDVGNLRNSLSDTAGVQIKPTHAFTTSDLHSFVTRQLDSSQRPVVTPQFLPGMPPVNEDGSKWSNFTGIVLPGALYWFTDDLIPAVGSNTRVVVSRPDQIVTFEGGHILQVYPQAVGNQASIVVNLYAYVAVIPRQPGATAFTSSNAYPLTAK